MLEGMITTFVGQAPWVAIILIVIYFLHRELKRRYEELREANERILSELRSRYDELKRSDEKILYELRESDRRILSELRSKYDELKESDEKLRGDIREMGERLRGEMKEMGERLRGEMKEMEERLRGEMKEMGERLRGEMKEMGERLRGEMESFSQRLGSAVFGIHELLLGFLSSRDLISSDEADILKGASRDFLRAAGIAINPMSKEEWRRLAELVDKEIDELTHAEALELYDLAVKAVSEKGEHIGAIHLFSYAVVMKYLTRKRERKKEDKER